MIILFQWLILPSTNQLLRLIYLKLDTIILASVYMKSTNVLLFFSITFQVCELCDLHPLALINVDNSNSNSTFIALNLYLMIDSKTQKAKIRDRNR